MTDPSPVTNTVAELRSAFDRAYATMPSTQGIEQAEHLLAIRVAGDGYAIRVGEMTGLANDRKIHALPSTIPELLGVAGIRGALVPIYSLASLLGYNREAEQTRWLALCGSKEPLGLAFAGFEGYFQVPATHVYAAGPESETRGHVKEAVRAGDLVRAVVCVSSVIEAIQQRCGRDHVSKKR